MLDYSESFKVWVKLIFSFKTFSWLCWNLQLPLGIFVHDAGGSLLPHPGRHVAVGQHGLLPHGLRPVPRHERLGALPDRLHHREVHRHLSPHEGPGKRLFGMVLRTGRVQVVMDKGLRFIYCIQLIKFLKAVLINCSLQFAWTKIFLFYLDICKVQDNSSCMRGPAFASGLNISGPVTGITISLMGWKWWNRAAVIVTFNEGQKSNFIFDCL